jgi:uncharacterized membrane protein YdfJ with MMPL/SSD domain
VRYVLGRIADLTWRRPKLVLAAVAVITIGAAAIGRDVEDHLLAAGFTDPASESETATGLLIGSLGYNPSPGIVVLVRDPEGGRLDVEDPKVRREVDRLETELGHATHVGNVLNPLTDGREAATLLAEDGRSLLLSAQLTIQDVEDAGGVAAEDARERIGDSTLDVNLGGYASSFNDVNDQTRDDLINAELIAFPILALLLLIVFRGVIAAGIPLLIGGISIVSAFFALRVMSEFVDTSIFALNLATGLSLGLAVDYGLLMVSRYREELARDGPSREAHRRTVTTAGRTVLFSGFTVAVALAALVLMPQRFLYSIGVAGAVVGIVSAGMALLVVSSLLSILGERIDKFSIRRGPPVSATSDGWYRLARGVMRRPVAVALASSAVLLAIAWPVLSTVLTGPSAEAVAPSLASYEPNQYMEDNYPRDVSEAVTVTVQGDAGKKELAALSREIGSIDGVASGTPFATAPGDVAYATFALDAPALEDSSQNAVEEIRALAAPGELYVAGNTAGFLDLKESLTENIPLVIALVAGATFLLVFMLTGSIILPLKTLVMNALTLAAALGIITLAFEEGLLQGLFDYTGPDAVETVSLVFLFAVIFGLATDYAVLVMARIKEEHDLGAANEDAVATGIARTGRVITAAALMIAVVFLAFAVSPIFFMKQIAVGMAVGVIIDATIVRALLVPSLMRLFGEFNWWAPGPLRRFQARYGFREA